MVEDVDRWGYSDGFFVYYRSFHYPARPVIKFLGMWPVAMLDRFVMPRLFKYDEKERGKNIYLVFGF